MDANQPPPVFSVFDRLAERVTVPTDGYLHQTVQHSSEEQAAKAPELAESAPSAFRRPAKRRMSSSDDDVPPRDAPSSNRTPVAGRSEVQRRDAGSVSSANTPRPRANAERGALTTPDRRRPESRGQAATEPHPRTTNAISTRPQPSPSVVPPATGPPSPRANAERGALTMPDHRHPESRGQAATEPRPRRTNATSMRPRHPESRGQVATEPRPRRTNATPTRPQPLPSVMPAAIDLNAGRRRPQRTSRAQRGSTTRRTQSTRLQTTTPAAVRVQGELVIRAPDDSGDGSSESLPARPSAAERDALIKQAKHKVRPKTQYVWRASSPPPKLFVPPRMLRELGEAGLAKQQQFKVDKTVSRDRRVESRRGDFERNLNRTDASRLFPVHIPDPRIDARLVALTQASKRRINLNQSASRLHPGQINSRIDSFDHLFVDGDAEDEGSLFGESAADRDALIGNEQNLTAVASTPAPAGPPTNASTPTPSGTPVDGGTPTPSRPKKRDWREYVREQQEAQNDRYMPHY